MNCSKCGSINCRRFEIVRQEGTFSSSSSEFSDVRSQSDLAKRCNPPRNYFLSIGMWLNLLIGILALPTGCMLTTRSGSGFPANVGLGFLTMFITLLVLFFILKILSRTLGFTGSYEQKLKQWNKSFMCLDCGKTTVHMEE